MSYPACFESQRQYDEWTQVADSVYHYKAFRVTSYCTDCTPDYAKRMRAEGRCEHPEVIFYRSGRAFIGIHGKATSGRLEGMDGNWELVNESDAEKSSVNA